MVNGILFQYSDPYVSGPLAQVLPNLSIPAVWFFNWILLHDASTRKEAIGCTVVFFGVAIGIVPALLQSQDDPEKTQSNWWPAVLGFGISAIFQGLEQTF